MYLSESELGWSYDTLFKGCTTPDEWYDAIHHAKKKLTDAGYKDIHIWPPSEDSDYNWEISAEIK